MENNLACEMLDVLSAELYSEIFIHHGGYWDEKTTILANDIIEAVKNTREKMFGPVEDI